SSFNSVLHKDLTTKTSAGNLSVQGGTYTQGTTMAQVLGLAPSGVAAAGANDTSNVFITNGTMNFSAFGGTSTDESKGYQNMIKLVPYTKTRSFYLSFYPSIKKLPLF
ncbi:MAG: hypothetical protein IJ934_04075, partial [Acetobacter sp.]|nr:hypothetical protein [Acetobacter sp.]